MHTWKMILWYGMLRWVGLLQAVRDANLLQTDGTKSDSLCVSVTNGNFDTDE